jgi:spore maturation protein CgeB
MNTGLLDTVKRDRPALTVVVPFRNEFRPEVMDEIKQYTTSVAYFFDDMWRRLYSHFWASHFSYVTTSDVNGVRRFAEAGHANALYSPFACNQDVFVRTDSQKIYDVSFVGGYHPTRAWWIKKLRDAGVEVAVWGEGWGTQRVSQEDLVKIFNQTKINLNLSNSAMWDLRYVLTLNRPMRDTVRAWRGVTRSLYGRDSKISEQVKGRHFEIGACGGFQASYYVEGLELHYQLRDEIVIYVSPDDLVETIRYYLKHNAEREAIANRAYVRTLMDHRMERRLADICNQIGLGHLAAPERPYA